MQVANFCSKHGGGWAFLWRNLGSVFSKQRAWTGCHSGLLGVSGKISLDKTLRPCSLPIDASRSSGSSCEVTLSQLGASKVRRRFSVCSITYSDCRESSALKSALLLAAHTGGKKEPARLWPGRKGVLPETAIRPDGRQESTARFLREVCLFCTSALIKTPSEYR